MNETHTEVAEKVTLPVPSELELKGTAAAKDFVQTSEDVGAEVLAQDEPKPTLH
jgi:hypothetical protein